MNPLEEIDRRLESKDISAEEEEKLFAILLRSILVGFVMGKDGVAEKLSDRSDHAIREEEK